MATKYTNALGSVIPAGQAASLLWQDGAGNVGFVFATASGQVPTWNSSTSTWVAQSVPLVIPYNVITVTSSPLLIETNNKINFTGAISVSLPTTATVGQNVWIYAGNGVCTITQAAAQQIIGLNNTTTTLGTGGNLAITSLFGFVELICTTANNVFQVGATTGTLAWT